MWSSCAELGSYTNPPDQAKLGSHVDHIRDKVPDGFRKGACEESKWMVGRFEPGLEAFVPALPNSSGTLLRMLAWWVVVCSSTVSIKLTARTAFRTIYATLCCAS